MHTSRSIFKYVW